MRWKVRPHGETRRLKRFALFPVLIDGEWVWLEFYTKVKTWLTLEGVTEDIRKKAVAEMEKTGKPCAIPSVDGKDCWLTRLELGWQPAVVTVEEVTNA